MSSSVFSRASTTRSIPSSAHDARAALVVHGHLRRAVDLEPGIDPLDQPHEPDVLHDRRIDAAIDRLAEEHERVGELGRLHEDVEREVDPRAARRARAARSLELVERELRALVARVESLGAEIDGVGAVRDGGAHGVERAGRGEELRDATSGNALAER